MKVYFLYHREYDDFNPYGIFDSLEKAVGHYVEICEKYKATCPYQLRQTHDDYWIIDNDYYHRGSFACSGFYIRMFSLNQPEE